MSKLKEGLPQDILSTYITLKFNKLGSPKSCYIYIYSLNNPIKFTIKKKFNKWVISPLFHKKFKNIDFKIIFDYCF